MTLASGYCRTFSGYSERCLEFSGVSMLVVEKRSLERAVWKNIRINQINCWIFCKNVLQYKVSEKDAGNGP